MDISTHLRQLGGVADRATLVRSVGRRRFDRARRAKEIVRDARGRYAVPVADAAVRKANALSGVVSHRSAALGHGWEVKTVPEFPDVTLPRKRHLRKNQRAGVALHWADLTADERDGVCTSKERTVLDCMRSLPFDEALAIADSALRHRDVTRDRLIELAEGARGPGAPQARKVARHADGRAANPFESALRAISIDVPGLDVEPQLPISDDFGTGYVDLADAGLRLVLEAESHEWHSTREGLRKDCRRYTQLVLLGWRVLRFSWEDVMFHADYVRRSLCEAVDLAHGQARSSDDQTVAA